MNKEYTTAAHISKEYTNSVCISKNFYDESKRMFNTYCNMYGLTAQCCHSAISNCSYQIYMKNKDFDETCELIDDAMRWILKPYRKRHRDVNIRDQTEDIKTELLRISE